MTEILCPRCGGLVPGDEHAPAGEQVSVRCPGCGAEIRYRLGSPALTTRFAPGAAAEATRDPAEPPAAAVEQPAATIAAALDSLSSRPVGSAGAEEPAATIAGPLDRTVLAPAGVAPRPPPLGFAGSALFLVVGGAPGRERLPLPSARTVFGRTEADVDLGDPAVSGRHFQVEAAGREFFIRDLGSRNGTFVNGRRIRYAELLPGDEVLAGSTYLVFRTSEDALGRPPEPPR